MAVILPRLRMVAVMGMFSSRASHTYNINTGREEERAYLWKTYTTSFVTVVCTYTL